ncbi:InlB B-repeat-containing protein [Candidatus Saccharibacteria bacterium]|nr:InlB B-repeat-containing protein [Candidatus Saccharibacteria bacterium]
MKRTNTKSIFGALCLFFAISLFSVFCSISFNTISVSAYSAAISTSNSVTLDATINGTGTSIKAESINIQTDCRAGYNLNIATPNGSNLYLNGNNSENASFTAVDGTSALSSSNNTNKWGYTLATNPTSSTVFLPLSANTSVLKTPAQTASPNSNINDTFNINYGVHTDETITPGAYRMGNNGTIVYYLTMDETCMTVNIAYDGNNADAGTMGAAGTGIIHTGVKDGDTIDLIASNFSRTGYGFAGWSTDQNAGAKLTDNDNTNNPIVYGPQETVTLPNGFTNYDTDNDGIVKLYAVWIPSQGNLQGWMGCSSLDTAAYDSTTGALDLTKKSVTALTDQRDNDTYAVARLADGKCWMIENLRLDNTNSDNSTGDLAQGYGISATYGNFEGLANAESSNFTASGYSNSLYYSGTQSGTATVNIGTSDNPSNRIPRYNNLNTQFRANNPTGNTFSNNNTSGGMYSYGNYYTWAAAIANTTAYTTDGQPVTDTSLCPIGWRLPQGGDKTRITSNDDNDFWNLTVDALNGGINPANYDSVTRPYYTDITEAGPVAVKLRSFPNNFLYSGDFQQSSLAAGGIGHYWSSTANNGTNSYELRLGNNYVYPGTNRNSKYIGYSIRCVASESETFVLTYNANGGFGAPVPQTISANVLATFSISSTTPTRSGYTFAGWTDEKGNEVQAGGSFTTKDPNAVLYAIWTNNNCNPTATTIGTGNTSTDAVCLQDVTPSMKAALPTATATTGTYNLIDARDNQSYTIAKLPDDNLWMTKNLNYSSINLNTSYDTDTPTTFRLPESTTTSNTNNTTASIRTTNNSGNNNNGTYYSWPAAIASTASYSSGNVASSICPKGWDLPPSNAYTNLKTQADYKTGNLTTSAPSSFLINGGFTNGASFYQTSYSHFWTSTVSSSSAAYGARVNGTTMTTSSTTSTTYGGNKYYRKNIRCIASNGTVTINYEGNGTAEYPVTGTVASQTNVDIISTNTQPGTGFTRTGWVFNGWNTAADGTGTAIAASTAITNLNPTPGFTITLYAQWLPQYTITYVNNCQTYASANTSCTTTVSNDTSEQKINLTSNPSTGTETGILAAYNKWTLTGWKIAGWTTNADGTGTEYRVSTTYTVPSGSSVGSGITLYAHWVPVYSIQYDGNGADNSSTGMGSTDPSTGIKSVAHTNVAEGDTFDLFASNFKRAGYGFVGWSTDSDAWNKLTDNDTTNDAKIWGPNEIITAPAYNGMPIITLYAIWAPAETDGSNPVYLQNWTGCSAMTATTYDTTTGTLTVAKDSITALTDQRDNQVYTIAKLADENCWMVENLRLDNTPELSTTNTNINSNNSTLPITNEYGSTTSNYLSATSSSWCTNQNAACYDQSRLNTTNTTANVTPSQTQNVTSANAHTNFNNTIYSYGNYYNWYSATAGYGTYSRTTSEPTAGDLCPAGWKLPYGNTGTSGTTSIGGTKGGFYYLANRMSATASNQVNSNKFRMFPNNFIYSGYWRGSSADNRGGYGSYWSASASGSSYAYGLGLDRSYVNPGNYYNNKYYGFAVRCIANKTINSITYMQEFKTLSERDKTDVLNSMIEGEQYQLKDNRDEKTYYVSKLADGNVWMTQNLDHDIVTTTDFYTPTNTDIPSNWTASTATYPTGTTTWNSSATAPRSYDPGNKIWDGGPDRHYNTVLDNMGQGTNIHYHLGNYYNWSAAVAMNDTSSYSTQYQNIDQSICPAGWTLPTGGNNSSQGSFKYLHDQYGWNSALPPRVWYDPMYYTFGGTWIGYSDAVASEGTLWSSTVGTSSTSYVMNADCDGGVVTQNSSKYKSSGYSVRCVAR